MTNSEVQEKIHAYDLSLNEILNQVVRICLAHHVEHVYLFGSYAVGTARPTSDIDIVIKGGEDIERLRDEIDWIPTLKRIDLFFYDEIRNPYLLDDIHRYSIDLPIKGN